MFLCILMELHSKMKTMIEQIAPHSEEASVSWVERARFYRENRAWLDRSAQIAMMVYSTLRAKKMTQKALAKLIDVSPQYVSKLLKGSENLSLQTISKLEAVLDITLIDVIIKKQKDDVYTTKDDSTCPTITYLQPFTLSVKHIAEYNVACHSNQFTA